MKYMYKKLSIITSNLDFTMYFKRFTCIWYKNLFFCAFPKKRLNIHINVFQWEAFDQYFFFFFYKVFNMHFVYIS